MTPRPGVMPDLIEVMPDLIEVVSDLVEVVSDLMQMNLPLSTVYLLPLSKSCCLA